ncbi:MAG: hypothetical protein K9I85_11420 [Saprospiraceae bacterium]|nr:hypothetical protein [Saprospiraceae bacterium]
MMPDNPYLPILADFEIVPQGKEQFDEAEVLEMLTKQIAWMLETKTEFLFSLLYRLDVDERLVRRAMDPSEETPAAAGLARLVFDRQMARMQTKRDIRVDDIDPDLAW